MQQEIMRQHSKAYWDRITSDRSALMEMMFAQSDPSIVWSGICSLLRESDSTGGTPWIYELYHRTYLPVLQFELVCRFIERFSQSGSQAIASSLEDEDPAVVGYSLFALSMLGLDELRKGAQLVTSRLEKVHASSGSFGWEGTLAEYAERLVASKEEEES